MHAPRLVFAVLAALALAGCPQDPPPDEPDAGAPPPDACNSLEEALSQPDCALALGENREAFLGQPGDEDWYSFQSPANANARTLLHITGYYAAPNTAVNLSLNLLREDGAQSLARKSDRHGQAPPAPVDIILPFAEPNARLVLLVADDPVNPSRPNFDVRAPYRLMVEALEDPDVNEPNDTTPTAITLAPQGGAEVGTQTGYLSTNWDVDTFSFDVAAGKVLYLAVTAPQLTPPPPFRLNYELYDPAGTRISEGTVQNAFLPVDLATARRIQTGGTYRLDVKGYVPQGQVEPVPGDVRLQYAVDVRVFDEADPSELTALNDTLETATAVALASPGQTGSVSGRTAAVPDPDWYRVDLAAQAQPSVLHYRLVPGTQGQGRFPELPTTVDRQVRVVRQVTSGGDLMANRTACLQDPAVCPKSFGDDPFLAGLVSEECSQNDPPLCVWAVREEHPNHDGLRNFQGTLPIPPHGSTLSLYFLVQDGQNNWADDVDYTLELSWRTDPDDAARYAGGAEQTQVKALAQDVSASTYPVPPQGAAYELTGRLSHGFGYLRDNDPNSGDGVRGPRDYDAVQSDRDRFELTLPNLDPDAGYLDRSWEIEWEVEKANGDLPYDLAVELQFCDGDLSTAQCIPVKTASRGAGLTLSYTDAERDAWHRPQTGAARQPLYDRTETASATITTGRAYGCFCFEPRFIKGGKFYLTVLAVDRESYDDTPYTVRTAYTSYPKSFGGGDGGTLSCPPRDADGGSGCYFTYQP